MFYNRFGRLCVYPGMRARRVKLDAIHNADGHAESNIRYIEIFHQKRTVRNLRSGSPIQSAWPEISYHIDIGYHTNRTAGQFQVRFFIRPGSNSFRPAFHGSLLPGASDHKRTRRWQKFQSLALRKAQRFSSLRTSLYAPHAQGWIFIRP